MFIAFNALLQARLNCETSKSAHDSSLVHFWRGICGAFALHHAKVFPTIEIFLPQ
jgi:hypothetical protein